MVQRLAGEVSFFGDEPILLVLLVAIVLVLGNVGTLGRITLCVEVALVDLFKTRLGSAHLYQISGLLSYTQGLQVINYKCIVVEVVVGKGRGAGKSSS